MARDPGAARTEVGRVCIPDVRRAVHRGLSLREGMLAKASAVRPRATPQTQKKGTHKQHGHRADNTHTLRGVRHDTQPHAVTHVSQQHAVRTHKHADARVTARTVQWLLKRCCCGRVGRSVRPLAPRRPSSGRFSRRACPPPFLQDFLETVKSALAYSAFPVFLPYGEGAGNPICHGGLAA